jgi:hypothetical protein
MATRVHGQKIFEAVLVQIMLSVYQDHACTVDCALGTLFYSKNAQSSQMKLGNIFFLKQSERRSASWIVPMSQE